MTIPLAVLLGKEKGPIPSKKALDINFKTVVTPKLKDFVCTNSKIVIMYMPSSMVTPVNLILNTESSRMLEFHQECLQRSDNIYGYVLAVKL